ncbi:MAG: hypothetical protein R3E79_08630 [Caldilineaceae bacterium]
MDAYEFSTQVMETGYVAIPTEYIHQIPQGTAVRVLILVDESNVQTSDQHSHENEIDSLEALIAEIKSKPINPETIQHGDGLLAWRLANPVTEPDPEFDEATWNQEWDQIELAMKNTSLTHEKEEWENLAS